MQSFAHLSLNQSEQCMWPIVCRQSSQASCMHYIFRACLLLWSMPSSRALALNVGMLSVLEPLSSGRGMQVTTQNLERVRRIKNRMVRLTTKVETIREVLEKFLDDDSDMKDMNLTARVCTGFLHHSLLPTILQHALRELLT